MTERYFDPCKSKKSNNQVIKVRVKRAFKSYSFLSPKKKAIQMQRLGMKFFSITDTNTQTQQQRECIYFPDIDSES